MKRKPIPLFKIGLFVLVGFVFFILFIFFIGSKKNLFKSTSLVYARFKNVSSLKTGAQVQIAGINVGNVKHIYLPRHANDLVTVALKIDDEALPLLRPDSKTTITT